METQSPMFRSLPVPCHRWSLCSVSIANATVTSILYNIYHFTHQHCRSVLYSLLIMLRKPKNIKYLPNLVIAGYSVGPTVSSSLDVPLG